MQHTVLMGDATHFSVVGGANPHTRDRYGRKKTVNREEAIVQWKHMHDLLRDQGLRVVVIPPNAKHPGLVYPANAGVRVGDDFILSNLTPTRAGEQAAYRDAIEPLGLRVQNIESRFEGEADLFPCGELYLFTYGEIRKQRFVPRLGWPPWKRIYGFRSQPKAVDEIEAIRPLGKPILQIRLNNEGFYHGDTCLCSFGENREHLLAYMPVLDHASREKLREQLNDRIVEIGDADAAIYAANSFHFERAGEPCLVMPDGISDDLEARIRERGVHVLKTNVSEFYKKGGGSVKCMIGDLGKIPIR